MKIDTARPGIVIGKKGEDVEQLRRQVSKMIVIAGAILFFGLIGIVGNMSLEDALNEERHYAEMVCDGHWPDYKDISPECE